MSSMMALGLSLEQVVPMVTSNPAKLLARASEIGALKVGMDADISVLTQRAGRFVLRDNEDTREVADSLLQPLFCLRAGLRYDADASILPEAVAA
jgi:dihydroorotase